MFTTIDKHSTCTECAQQVYKIIKEHRIHVWHVYIFDYFKFKTLRLVISRNRMGRCIMCQLCTQCHICLLWDIYDISQDVKTKEKAATSDKNHELFPWIARFPSGFFLWRPAAWQSRVLLQFRWWDNYTKDSPESLGLLLCYLEKGRSNCGTAGAGGFCWPRDLSNILCPGNEENIRWIGDPSPWIHE